MNLLVTGGLGYIGGRFCEFAAAQTGANLTITTRRADAAGAVQVQPGDSARWSALCRGIDAIVHLAGMNAADSARDPAHAIATRTADVGALLAAAREQGVPRLIYVSTAHVYGAALVGRVDEHTPPQPAHPYGHSHLAAEDCVREARARGDVDAIVVRLSNTFGAAANDAAEGWKLVANGLCREAAQSRRITLLTRGLQRRDFIPMSDACRALWLLCSEAKLPADTFNLGGDDAPTILELAGRIAARTQARLGFTPEIITGTKADTVGTGPLDFRSDRLRGCGYAPSPGAALAELDRLIETCARSAS